MGGFLAAEIGMFKKLSYNFKMNVTQVFPRSPTPGPNLGVFAIQDNGII